MLLPGMARRRMASLDAAAASCLAVMPADDSGAIESTEQ